MATERDDSECVAGTCEPLHVNFPPLSLRAGLARQQKQGVVAGEKKGRGSRRREGGGQNLARL